MTLSHSLSLGLVRVPHLASIVRVDRLLQFPDKIESIMIPRFTVLSESDSDADEDTSDEAYVLRHVSLENEERKIANRRTITIKEVRSDMRHVISVVARCDQLAHAEDECPQNLSKELIHLEDFIRTQNHLLPTSESELALHDKRIGT